jgi:hypothetical protein
VVSGKDLVIPEKKKVRGKPVWERQLLEQPNHICGAQSPIEKDIATFFGFLGIKSAIILSLYS